jgi:predicted transposase YdaD
MAVDLSRYYAWKEQQRAEGRIEGEARGRLVGRLEGRLEGEADGRLLGGIEARLRRVLTDEELTRFRRRVARDGRDAVHQRALALDDRELARWVAGKRVRSN